MSDPSEPGGGPEEAATGPPDRAPPSSRRRRWLRVGFVVGTIALVAALVGVYAGSRTASRGCPTTGCAPFAVFDLTVQPQPTRDAVVTATVCLDGTCTTLPIAPEQNYFTVDLHGPVVAVASVQLRDAAGADLGLFETTRPLEAAVTPPEGEGCDPPCPLLRLHGRDGVLEPVL